MYQINTHPTLFAASGYWAVTTSPASRFCAYCRVLQSQPLVHFAVGRITYMLSFGRRRSEGTRNKVRQGSYTLRQVRGVQKAAKNKTSKGDNGMRIDYLAAVSFRTLLPREAWYG